MSTASTPRTTHAVRLHADGGPTAIRLDEIATPVPGAGEALVRVYAAAITRDELTWPVDRLPAIPSYELSGVVVDLGGASDRSLVGEAVYALTPFDRDGVASELAVVPVSVLARKPESLDHVHAAAVPMAALTAWQGLFEHGRLDARRRVLIHGASGGVGHVATQLARQADAHVIATVSSGNADAVRALGADEVLDAGSFDALAPVDLVFDTAGGDVLARSAAVVRHGGRLVSIAEEPPPPAEGAGVQAVYFVVEPNREQLEEISRIVDEGELRPEIDTVFPLEEARAAFEHLGARGKRGKVVLRVRGESR